MAQSTASGDATLGSTPVVDVDVHLSPDPDDVATYCDQPYRRRLENPSTFPKASGSDWMQPTDRIDDADRLTDPDRVRSLVCDRLGVDHPILNLHVGLQKLTTDDLAVHLMRAYNDYLIDRFLDDTGFHGLAELTTQDPAAAAEELDRLSGEDGIVGALIGNTGPERPLGDPRYDVLYRAAEDNGLPIVFHPASGPHFRNEFSKQNQGVTTAVGVDTLSHLWSQTLTVGSLVVQGVPEKFPELEFVFLETGAAWVPYMMWRLNKEYAIQKVEAPLLTRSPEQYLRDSFYFSTHSFGSPNDSGHRRTVVDAVGADALVFASNAPYADAETRADLAADLAETFREDELEAILSGTAAEVFGIAA